MKANGIGETMQSAVECEHPTRDMMLGEQGKGIAQWCVDCGALNPGENRNWQKPRAEPADVSQEIRHQLEMAYERIEDLEKRLVKERVEHGETFLRAKKSDGMLREIKLTMPHVEAGYDDYDAEVKKLEAEIEECGKTIERQAGQVAYYRRERDRLLNEHQTAIDELNDLRKSASRDVHEIKDMEADLRNHRAKETFYRGLLGSACSVLNGESDAHKIYDES